MGISYLAMMVVFFYIVVVNTYMQFICLFVNK